MSFQKGPIWEEDVKDSSMITTETIFKG